MTIDKNWTILHKNSIEFWNGLQTFLSRCKDHLNFESKCRCPCCKCNNVEFGTIESLERHIHSNGFSRAYRIWIYHGEPRVSTTVPSLPQTTDEMRDALNHVLQENIRNNHDAEGPSDTNVDLDDLFTLANTDLYPGCDWMSSLDFLAKISHMKAMNHWTDISIEKLLELLRFAFPKDNKLPKSHYEAKKLMKMVRLGYESIHACKNDCCLFWKENKDMQTCPICHESRWKNKDTKGLKVANKVLCCVTFL